VEFENPAGIPFAPVRLFGALWFNGHRHHDALLERAAIPVDVLVVVLHLGQHREFHAGVAKMGWVLLFLMQQNERTLLRLVKRGG